MLEKKPLHLFLFPDCLAQSHSKPQLQHTALIRHFFGITHMHSVSSSLLHAGLSDVLLLLYCKINGSNSPLRLTGIAHCSHSFLARAAPMQPDKPPVLCREGPAKICFQEPKNQLQLRPLRTPSITHPGALWSEATARHHPLPATRSRVWLAFVLTHITDFSGAWSPRAIHLFCSQVLLSSTLLGFLHPSLLAISSLSLAGHFLPMPLNRRGFFPPSKELVTFTAW